MDVDPAHPLAHGLERQLNDMVIIVAVASQQIFPRLGDLAHIALADQVLELIIAFCFAVGAAQHYIGDLVVDGTQEAQVHADARDVAVTLGEGQEVVDKRLPTFPIQKYKEVGQGLGELVLEMWGVDGILGGLAAIMLLDIAKQGLLEQAEPGAIKGLVLDGMVDDLETDEADDGGRWRVSGEKTKADLPGLGVGSELVQEFEGLALEGLVGAGVPGDLDRIFNLVGGIRLGNGV
jgi:hypothetical protein